jgi:hypothetical protein
MRREDPSTTRWTAPLPRSRFDATHEILRLTERVAWLEATAQHGTEMVRWALKRTDQAHGRIDLTDARVDRQAADLSAINGALRARETDAQHRQATAILALKGVGLVLTLLTLAGVLIGKLPADALKWVTGGAFVK